MIGGGAGPDGKEDGAAWGCFCSISFSMSGEGGARPFEERALIALRYCPF